MIITLKRADFSLKNIGTLSTWTIFTTLGKGASYSGSRTVDKNGSLSATVTIADGYQLGSAGVTVLMGDADISSSSAIVSGNTITINIATVTGNVTIKVPTLNPSTGEEEGGGSGSTIEPLNLVSQMTWTDGSQMIADSTNEKFGMINPSSSGRKYSNHVPIDARYDTLTLTMLASADSASTGGLVFFNSYDNPIKGEYISGASANGVVERTYTIPSGATYFVTTMWTATSSTYPYNMNGYVCYLSKARS